VFIAPSPIPLQTNPEVNTEIVEQRSSTPVNVPEVGVANRPRRVIKPVRRYDPDEARAVDKVMVYERSTREALANVSLTRGRPSPNRPQTRSRARSPPHTRSRKSNECLPSSSSWLDTLDTPKKSTGLLVKHARRKHAEESFEWTDRHLEQAVRDYEGMYTTISE
jgi:hypothetical protein